MKSSSKGLKIDDSFIMELRRLEGKLERMRHDLVEKEFPGEEVKTPYGTFFLSTRSASELPETRKPLSRFMSIFGNPRGARYGVSRIASRSPRKSLFLDIETTGLSSRCPIFLCGLMYFDGLEFKFEQLLARDFSEEAPMLCFLGGRLDDFELIITFNGRSFDLPYILDRMAYHGIPLPKGLMGRNYDVLLYSRRKWKGRVTNCKLQTLEKEICGRRRMGDIPSSLIPETYQEFIGSGDVSLLKPIMYHNLIDLVSMAELIAALLD
ncbi:ribonuclease H-like domain-containing protein [Candidatus Poribacteria bacterium]|nr:ribonuclease H-like domain-containing protein [Candidatus Poribacteria bacterium]